MTQRPTFTTTYNNNHVLTDSIAKLLSSATSTIFYCDNPSIIQAISIASP